MIKNWVLAVGFVLLTTTLAYGIELTYENERLNASIEYTEPTTNADGTPLTDLRRCFGNIDLKGDGQSRKTWSIPASSNEGGKSRSASVVFSLTEAEALKVTEIEATGQCEDLTTPPNVSQTVTISEPLKITIPTPSDTTSPAPPIIRVIIAVTVSQ